MEQTTYFEDYEIGSQRVTYGRTITETDFVVHAGHTGDFFPHHMDAEFMKTQPFGQRIAHGTMVFSIGVGLTASVINPVAFSYGYDRLRFVKPVFIGDTIHTRTTIASALAAGTTHATQRRMGSSASCRCWGVTCSAARAALPAHTARWRRGERTAHGVSRSRTAVGPRATAAASASGPSPCGT